jgi:transcriptional regulator NrdR family protein
MSYDIETCEKCNGFSHITDSRPSADGRTRRRECTKCKHRWSTVEIRLTEYQRLRAPGKTATKIEQAIQDLLHSVQNRFMP